MQLSKIDWTKSLILAQDERWQNAYLISPADLNLRVQVQEKGRGKHVVRVKFSPMGEGFRVFFSDLI